MHLKTICFHKTVLTWSFSGMQQLIPVFRSGLGSVKGFLHPADQKGLCRRHRVRYQLGVLMAAAEENFDGGDGSWHQRSCIMGIGGK